LFNQKNRGEASDAPHPGANRTDATASAATEDPGAGKAVAQSTRRPEPPTHGGNHVANIGKSISIKGDLTGNEDIVIEGTVEGKVDLPNNQLTVGADGTVRAEVNAKAVVVVGKVTGNVQGTERIEIQATGVVDGDVMAPKLIVAEGAVVNGSIKMSGKVGAASGGGGGGAPTPNPEVRKAG
jgi:cytoskeletal protein CcmA (bactofilin family)